MEITYPFAKVFVDRSSQLNVFFCHDPQHTTFQQIGEIGSGIVDFCELDFSSAAEKIKALETMTVTNANYENMKRVCWNAVDLLKGKHPYAHFFLNSELLRNFNNPERTQPEQMDYAQFAFRSYIDLKRDYAEALEICLDSETLTRYTLPERFLMLCNLKPQLHAVYAAVDVRHCAHGRRKI